MEKNIQPDLPKSASPDFAIPEESARKILAHIPDAVIRMTGGGTILDYKPSALNLLKVKSGGELEGRHLSELSQLTSAFDDELLERCLRQVHLVLERNEPQRFEVQLKNSSWPLWLEIRAFRAGEDEVVVLIREVSRERRGRHYQEGELEEFRHLVETLDHEQRSRETILRDRLHQLAERAGDGEMANDLRALANEVNEAKQIEPRSLAAVLKSTINELCDGELEAHVRFDLACEHISPEVATGIHATLCEALSCASKHSSADRIRVSLVNTREVLSLLISDNSGEESIGDARARAVCLAKVRYQVQKLGGTLRVTPGRRGTAMRLQWPLVAN